MLDFKKKLNEFNKLFYLIKLIISQFFPFQRSVLHICSSLISCLPKCNIYVYLMYTSTIEYDQLTMNASIFLNHSIAVDFRQIPPKKYFFA